MTLWTEKYRPAVLNGYVFTDPDQRSQIESWIKEKEIPHLLFSGGPGTGKTTLAKILIKNLDIHPYDILELNASRENRIEDLRTKIMNFISTMPFGRMKIVLLDEADYMSRASQAALRGLMEEYAATSRFILTCNYLHKIIPAMRSRCQGFNIEKLDTVEFTARVAEILIAENIDFDLDVLDTYVRSTMPDLRKCINSVQQNSKNGQLMLTEHTGSTNDYMISAVGLIKQGKIREARSLICKQVRSDEIDELISWAYRNLDLWSDTEQGQDQAVLIIRKAAVNAGLVADHELNVAAMMVELSQIEG
jgi:replication factor C small subunit